MKLLITGASGYLGSQLVKAFSKKYRVIAVVRTSSSRARLANLPIDIVVADNGDHLNAIFKENKPDIVINTVALYGRKGEPVSSLIKANIEYPTQLLELSLAHQVQAFIHTGTSLPDDISAYALTKNIFVKLVGFQKLKQLKFVNIALEHFYGPGDDISKFISYVVHECKHNKELRLTEGSQKRDFIFIEDVISAYEVIVKQIDQLDNFNSISVGTGMAPSVRCVVEMIYRLSQSSSVLKFGEVPMRENELMYSCANNDKLSSLGWKAEYSLESGIKATLKGKK